ncbi:hypothetical protein ABZ746_09270 [Streptomyces sp. NPDC020096]
MRRPPGTVADEMVATSADEPQEAPPSVEVNAPIDALVQFFGSTVAVVPVVVSLRVAVAQS